MKSKILSYAIPAAVAACASASFAAGLSSAQISRAGANVSGSVDTGVFSANGGTGAIEWNFFNVLRGETATFNDGTFFNYVKGGSESRILGTIDGTASVWLFNPSGIFFGPGSVVNVGGVFAASTAAVANMDDLVAGRSQLPTLGAVGPGAVSVASGATLAAAGGVSIAARRISVEGGSTFDAPQTDMRAGGAFVLEKDIAGGKVTIDLADFADFDADIGVTFSGRGAVSLSGGLSVSANKGEAATRGGGLLRGMKAASDDDYGFLINSDINMPNGEMTFGEDTLHESGVVNVKNMVAEKRYLQDGISATITADEVSFLGAFEQRRGSITAGKINFRDAASQAKSASLAFITADEVNLAGAKDVALLGPNNAVKAIGGTADSLALKTSAGLSVNSLAAGSVEIAGAAGVTVAGAVQATAGEIDITAKEKLEIAGENAGAVASGDVTLTGKNVAIAGDVKSSGDSGVVAVKGSSRGKIEHVSGDIEGDTVVFDNATVSLEGGSITANTLEFSGNGSVEQESGAAIAAGEVVLDVDGGVGLSAGDNEVVKIGGVAASLDFVGTSESLEVGELTLDGVDASSIENGGDLVVAGAVEAGDLALRSTEGDIAVNAAVSGSDIGLDAAGGIAVSAAVSGADVSLVAAGDIAENAAVSATGDKSVWSESGDIAVNVAGTVAGNATYIAEDGDLDTGRNVTIAAGGDVSLRAGGGDVAAKSANGTVEFDIGDANGSASGANAKLVLKDGDVALSGTGNLAVEVENANEGGSVEIVAANGTVTVVSGGISADADVVVEGRSVETGYDISGESVAISGDLVQTAGAIAGDEVEFADAVSQSEGASVLTDSLTLDSAGKAVSLASSANEINSVGGTAGSLDLQSTTDVGVRQLASAGELKIVSDGAVVVGGATSGGNVTIDAQGVIVENAAVTATGKKTVHSETGDIKVNQTGAAAGDVAYTADAGAVTTASGKEIVSTGGNVAITAADGQGNVSARAANGKVSVAAGSVVADAEGANASVAKTGGSLSIGGAGDLSVSAAAPAGTVAVAAPGKVSVGGTGIAALGDVAVDGAAVETAADVAGANVSVDGALSQKSGAISGETVTFAGAVNQTAGAKVAADSLVLDSAGKDVQLGSSANDVKSVGGAAGSLVLKSGSSVSVGELSVPGTVSISSGADVTVGGTVNGGDVTLDAAGGVVENAAVSATGDKTVRSASGDIAVNENGLVGGDATYVADAGRVDTAEGVSIVSAGGDASVQAAQGGNVVAGVAAEGGTVSVDTGDKLVGATGAGATVTTTEKDVAVTGGGDLTVAVRNEGGNVSVESAGGKVVVGEVGDGSGIAAGGDVAVNGGAVAVSADVSGANVGISGDLSHSSGAIVGENVTIAGGVAQSDGAKVVADSLTLDAEGKDVVLASSGNGIAQVGGTTGGLVVENGKSLTVDGLEVGGDMRLEASGAGAAVTVDGKVSVSGSATILAGGDVNMEADVAVTGAGSTIDVAAEGGVNMANGVTASSQGGNIAVVSGGGDVGISSLDAGSGNVFLNADGEITIKESGTVQAGGLALDGMTIGTKDSPLDLDVSTLTFGSDADIYIRNARPAEVVAGGATAGGTIYAVNRVEKTLQIDSVDPKGSTGGSGQGAIAGVVSAQGDVVIENAGTLTVRGAVAAGRNVSVSVTGGDLVVADSGTVKGKVVDLAATGAYGGGGRIVGSSVKIGASRFDSQANVDSPIVRVENVGGNGVTVLAPVVTPDGRGEPYVGYHSGGEVVFVDGRLAGSDTATLSRLGSLEGVVARSVDVCTDPVAQATAGVEPTVPDSGDDL